MRELKESKVQGFDFDVDCGRPFQYRLVLTGLRLDGLSNDAIHADYTAHSPGKPIHPMMSVTYRVTPALADATFDGCDIDATIRLDPPLDPGWWPGEVRPGGERDMIPRSAETHGAFGPFVVPAETGRIELSFQTFVLNPPSPRSPEQLAHDFGRLVIDLVEQSVAWHSA